MCIRDRDYIVISCDMDYTFNVLLDKSYMDKTLKMMYENDKDYKIYGMFQAAYGIDSPEDLLKGEIMLDCSDIKIAPWMGDRIDVYKRQALEGKFRELFNSYEEKKFCYKSEGYSIITQILTLYNRELYNSCLLYTSML